MCGRFALNQALGQLRAYVRARRINTNGRHFTPSNNISPGSSVPVIYNEEINLCIWGVEIGSRTQPFFRCETIDSKRKQDIENRRCVIPIDGYFEWCKANGNQPYFFKKANGDLLFTAAFYTQSGRIALLTRDATKQVSEIHDRMPILFNLDEIPHWINGPNWKQMLEEKPPSLTFYPVSKSALRPSYNGPECVAQIKVKKQSTLAAFLQQESKEIANDSPET